MGGLQAVLSQYNILCATLGQAGEREDGGVQAVPSQYNILWDTAGQAREREDGRGGAMPSLYNMRANLPPPPLPAQAGGSPCQSQYLICIPKKSSRRV